MPSQTKSIAFVLRKKILSDKDQLVILFTLEQGKVACIAKGARSITSKRSPHLQTGNLIEVVLSKRNERNYINQTTLVSGFSTIKDDLHRMKYLYCLLFVLDKILPEGQDEGAVFQFTLETIKKIAMKKEISPEFLEGILQELMEHFGYQTEDYEGNIYEFVEQLINTKIPLP